MPKRKSYRLDWTESIYNEHYKAHVETNKHIYTSRLADAKAALRDLKREGVTIVKSSIINCS